MVSNLKVQGDEREKNYQLLIDSPKTKELVDLANIISPENQYVRDANALGIKIVKEKLKKEYNISFTQDDINKECQRYNLVFIEARNFKGKYTPEFLVKLQKFFDEKKIATSNHDYGKLLYVLAPGVGDTSSVELKYPCRDPLMFWKMPDDMFVLVDGSRNYINLVNLWKGFRHLSLLSARITHFVEYFVILSILAFGINFFYKYIEGYLGGFGMLFGIIVASIAGQSIMIGLRKSDRGSEQYKFNNHKYPVCLDKYMS